MASTLGEREFRRGRSLFFKKDLHVAWRNTVTGGEPLEIERNVTNQVRLDGFEPRRAHASPVAPLPDCRSRPAH
jgi:hypothetical protein